MKKKKKKERKNNWDSDYGTFNMRKSDVSNFGESVWG